MNSERINSGSAMKIMLEEEITTMPDPWRWRVLAIPICIPAGPAREGCSDVVKCNTESRGEGMHGEHAPFTPWDRSYGVMVWLQFPLLWIEVSPAGKLLTFFLSAKDSKTPLERNTSDPKRGKNTLKKKIAPPVPHLLPQDTAGSM